MPAPTTTAKFPLLSSSTSSSSSLTEAERRKDYERTILRGGGRRKVGSVIDSGRPNLVPLHPPLDSHQNLPLTANMGSSRRLLGRERSVHQILGGGVVADVMLWRRRNVTVGILLGTLAAWVVFERSGYTLLSLAASVMLLLISILFVWAKAAAILNRPPPPLPELHLSEEMMKEASDVIHSHVNALLSAWRDISLGKDSKLFYRVAGFLWLISVIGSWTDSLTLGYTSLLLILTVPGLYERYEDHIDDFLIMLYCEMLRAYDAYTTCFKKVRWWIMEKRKLD